jgi:hypothetical protein
MPSGYRIEQADWQRIDGLLSQVQQIKDLPLQAVELVPIPKAERTSSQLMAVIHYPKLLIMAGAIDTELNQRVARLPVLIPKIKEMQDSIQGVDLRWSEQITFIKKDVALPNGLKTLSQKQTEEAEKKATAQAAMPSTDTGNKSTPPLKTPIQEGSKPEPGTNQALVSAPKVPSPDTPTTTH